MPSSGHLIDPDLKDLLAASPDFELNAADLPAIRKDMMKFMSRAAKDDPDVRTKRMIAPGTAENGFHDVPVVGYFPPGEATNRPAILHIHGGGYVMGSPDMTDALNKLHAKALGCVIISVDYRLAPETAFPGPVEDCYAALRWLSQTPSLGVDPARIGVKGESAGGGLAAGLTLLARDRGGPSLLFQHLIYPMIDDRTSVEAAKNGYAGEFVWTHRKNIFGWTCLLGKPPGSDDVSPYAAAARASDLAGLPPTYLAVGALDLFVEENVDYARRLMRAGVPVELHVYPGAFHGFQLATEARVAAAAARDSGDALRAAFETGRAKPSQGARA